MSASASNPRLTCARVALVLGLLIGLGSWWETVTHIGNPAYVLPTTFPEGSTHAWYHAFREACGDIAHMAVFLVVFFGPFRWRTPETWWITLALMLGYYAPFWIGEPFLSALAAPNAVASAVHIAMAGLAFLGLILARPDFMQNAQITQARPSTTTVRRA